MYFYCNECDYISPFVRFTTGHIWACPPSEGDDYIFHCHPADQKIPKPKRLQEWYKKMLDKAVSERIVHDYKVRHVFRFSYCTNKVNECIHQSNPEDTDSSQLLHNMLAFISKLPLKHVPAFIDKTI